MQNNSYKQSNDFYRYTTLSVPTANLAKPYIRDQYLSVVTFNKIDTSLVTPEVKKDVQ